MSDPAHLVSSRCHPVELRGGVSIRPALQCDWPTSADVNGRREGLWRDVRQAAVGPAPTADGPAPPERHHLLQLPTDEVRRGGAQGDRGLQHLQVGLISEVRTPGGEAVTPQGVRVQGQLLERGEGGEEVSGEEAELVTVEEESPEGG